MIRNINVFKYKSFADISKEEHEMENNEICPNNAIGTFQNIFCNTPLLYNNKAPIWVNLSQLEAALYAPESELFKKYWADQSTDATRYGPAVTKIRITYMPLLLVKENPNKFLKLALETRRYCLKGNKVKMFRGNSSKGVNIRNKDGSEIDVTNPLDKFYMGLDQVAQFLNFCVLIQQLPTKEGQMAKDTNEIEKLEFDSDVLKELLNQYKEEGDKVKKDIDEKQLDEYKEKLKNLRAKYNNYCRAMINGDGGACDRCISFAQWISEEGKFNGKFVRASDNGFPIGIYNDGTDKVIDKKVKITTDMIESGKGEYKVGYHEGGGIKDETEKAKLLRLDAVMQCKKAIDQFIDSKALEEPKLNWFQNLWNSLVNGTWIANKLGLFFKIKNVKKNVNLTLKSDQFIPKLDEFENKKIESSKLIR